MRQESEKEIEKLDKLEFRKYPNLKPDQIRQTLAVVSSQCSERQ